MTNSRLKSSPSEALKHNRWTNLELGRCRAISLSWIWGSPEQRLPCMKTAPTMKQTRLVTKQRFNVARLKERSKSFPTSEPSTN